VHCYLISSLPRGLMKLFLGPSFPISILQFDFLLIVVVKYIVIHVNLKEAELVIKGVNAGGPGFVCNNLIHPAKPNLVLRTTSTLPRPVVVHIS
jgi:hypothetical protein